MVKLAIIADDLTGSLDTGIKFAKEGIPTQIFLHRTIAFDAIEADTEVIVIDTETRHLTAREAGKIVEKVVADCMLYGIRNYYKKTDSALRGHIGSELAALARKTGQTVYFIPALPREDRYTKRGIHYIRGIPVAESIFCKDPFNPVRHSKVSQIIKEEEELNVVEWGNALSDTFSPKTEVVVFDGRTEKDLEIIADYLEKNNKLSITAGCAGFAPHLAGRMHLRRRKPELPGGNPKLIILSGSINSVTGAQMELAAREGFYRRTLSPEEKLKPDYLGLPEGIALLEELDRICDSHDRIIIDVLCPDDEEATRQLAESCHISGEEIPGKIAGRIGELFLHMTGRYPEAAIMLIGGDTFYAAAMQCPGIALKPVYEPVDGTVFVKGITKDHNLSLLSKSGGFGEEDLLINLSHIILEKEKVEVSK